NTLKPVKYDESIKIITSINEITPNVLVLGTYNRGISTYNIAEDKLINQNYINQLLKLETRITFIEKDSNHFYIGGDKIIRFNVLNNSGLIKPDLNFSDNKIRALSINSRSNNQLYF